MHIDGRLMFVLTVAGGVVVVAAALVAERKARRLAADQLALELEVWEDETGSFGPPQTQAGA